MLCNSCGKSLDNSDKAGRCPTCEEAYILKKQQEVEELEKNKKNKKRKNITLEEITEENEDQTPNAITYLIYISQACLILSVFPILYYINPEATLTKTGLLFLFILFSIVQLRFVLELWFRLLHENVVLAIIAIIMPALLLRSLFVYDVKPIKQVTIISFCFVGLLATNFYYVKTSGKSIEETFYSIEENLSYQIIKKLPRSLRDTSY